MPVQGITSKDLRDARRFAKRASRRSKTTCTNPDSTIFVDHKSFVERPIQFRRYHISFDRQSPIHAFLIKRGLLCPHIHHWISWSGYHAETCVNLINSMPAVLFSAMEEAVNVVNSIDNASAPDTRSSTLCNLNTLSTEDMIGLEISEKLLYENEYQWEMESEIGYQVITIDPDRQVRRDHRINTRLASMFGMHREEMLSRLANHDLPLHYIEIDAISMLTLMVPKVPTPGRKVKYFRMLAGPSRSCILVAQYTVTIADSLGRITEVLANVHLIPCVHDMLSTLSCEQVRHSYVPITPADYDAAALRTPKACLHWSCGDLRCGAQLLQDATSDARIPGMSLGSGGAASTRLVARLLDALRGHVAAYARAAGPLRPRWDAVGQAHDCTARSGDERASFPTASPMRPAGIRRESESCNAVAASWPGAGPAGAWRSRWTCAGSASAGAASMAHVGAAAGGWGCEESRGAWEAPPSGWTGPAAWCGPDVRMAAWEDVAGGAAAASSERGDGAAAGWGGDGAGEEWASAEWVDGVELGGEPETGPRPATANVRGDGADGMGGPDDVAADPFRGDWLHWDRSFAGGADLING